jgi:hypothetical protein
MRPFYAIATALLVATPAIAKDTIPAATPVGKPLDCIQGERWVKETRVRSDEVIDFYMYSNKVYRNTLPIACPQLGFEQRFLHTTRGPNQYCSLDTITVLTDPNLTHGATCGLGKFQEVKLASTK